MPRVFLSDLAIRKLKPAGRQIQYWDLSLPSFGCRVNPRGTKTFNVMTGRKRRLVKLGNYPAMTLSAARKQAHQLIDERSNTPSISYHDAREAFIDRHLSTLKPSTAREQKNLIMRFPFSGEIRGVGLNDINRVLSSMPLGSARSAFNVFRTFLNWCVAHDYLSTSPLRRSPYKTTSRDRVLEDAELKAVWYETKHHQDFGKICRLLLLTGQRLNQITSLERSWVKDDAMVFPAHVMKGNKQHTIPSTLAVQEILKTLRGSSYLFPAPCGTKPFTSYSTAMNKFRAALPDIPHFTCHDFRRTLSTKMAEWEICPLDVTEALLDHTTGSRSAIQRIYDRHDRLPQMRRALELYQERLLSLGDNH